MSVWDGRRQRRFTAARFAVGVVLGIVGGAVSWGAPMAGGVEDADSVIGFADMSRHDLEEVLRHPTVGRRLGARLSLDDLAYVVETFGEMRLGGILEDRGYMVLESRRVRRWEELIEGDQEAVIVFVRLDGRAAHVGIDASGRRAVYSAAARYADLPERLREWFYSNRHEATEDWERAPADLIWVREPDQPNPMSVVIARLAASDGKPLEAQERILMRRGRVGGERQFVLRLIHDWMREWATPAEIEEERAEAHVGRYDINGDGVAELFVRPGFDVGFCGAWACQILVYARRTEGWVEIGGLTGVASGPPGPDQYELVYVWRDPTTGHRTVFVFHDGLRWTGTGYEWSCYRRCSRPSGG